MWEKSCVTKSMHHELKDLRQYWKQAPKRTRYWFRGYSCDIVSNWTYWWNTINTTDNKEIIYHYLHPNIKMLSAEITSSVRHKSRQCYVLSLFDPIKPYFKEIDCVKEILKSFVCENLTTINNTFISFPVGDMDF